MLVMQSKNLTTIQKAVKLKGKLLIMIMINILLLQNLTVENFAARLPQANLVSKSDIADKV